MNLKSSKKFCVNLFKKMELLPTAKSYPCTLVNQNAPCVRVLSMKRTYKHSLIGHCVGVAFRYSIRVVSCTRVSRVLWKLISGGFVANCAHDFSYGLRTRRNSSPGYRNWNQKLSRIGQIKGDIRHFWEDIEKIFLIDIWIFSQYLLRNIIY